MVFVRDATPEECTAAAARRRRMAKAYRPEVIRLLLVAQTPPEELDRYFYFPRVPKADHLFQAVVPHFLDETPARLDKRDQLFALRDLGVYVIDLKPEPCDQRPPSTFADNLVRRAKRQNAEHAILIKVDVYDTTFEPLRAAGIHVIDKRIPFPSTGRQMEFCRDFKDALETAKWKSRATCDEPA
jgi:hypothetical protein